MEALDALHESGAFEVDFKVNRDRGLSFEFFSFDNQAGNGPSNKRQRGDSIIFDSKSFEEGGIHEENAMSSNFVVPTKMKVKVDESSSSIFRDADAIGQLVTKTAATLHSKLKSQVNDKSLMVISNSYNGSAAMSPLPEGRVSRRFEKQQQQQQQHKLQLQQSQMQQLHQYDSDAITDNSNGSGNTSSSSNGSPEIRGIQQQQHPQQQQEDESSTLHLNAEINSNSNSNSNNSQSPRTPTRSSSRPKRASSRSSTPQFSINNNNTPASSASASITMSQQQLSPATMQITKSTKIMSKKNILLSKYMTPETNQNDAPTNSFYGAPHVPDLDNERGLDDMNDNNIEEEGDFYDTNDDMNSYQHQNGNNNSNNNNKPTPKALPQKKVHVYNNGSSPAVHSR